MSEPMNIHTTVKCKPHYIGFLIVGAIIGYLFKENQEFKKGV